MFRNVYTEFSSRLSNVNAGAKVAREMVYFGLIQLGDGVLDLGRVLQLIFANSHYFLSYVF